jgi:hypothetical protein
MPQLEASRCPLFQVAHHQLQPCHTAKLTGKETVGIVRKGSRLICSISCIAPYSNSAVRPRNCRQTLGPAGSSDSDSPMMLFRLSPVLTSLAILAGAPVAFADDPVLQQFSAEYRIRISIVSGSSTMSLRRDTNGEYVFETRARAAGLLGLFVRGGIDETSRFVVRDGRIRPLYFKRVDTISKDERDVELEFDWPNGRLLRRYDDVIEELEIPVNAVDPSLLFVVVMVDRPQGQEPQTYTLVERSHTELINIVEEGTETVETRAGKFPTIRYSHFSEAVGRTTRLWASPAIGHITVKMEQHDRKKKRASLDITRLSMDDIGLTVE